MTEKKRVVITGLGVVSSIGSGKDIFWNNLIKGKSGISKVEFFDTKDHFVHNAGEIKDFKPEEYLSPRKIKLMARASHLAIAATRLALHDSKLSHKKMNAEKTAVIFGTTSGEAQKIEEMDAVWVRHGKENISHWSIIQYPVHNISSNVSVEFKTKGPNRIFTTACAAGNYAIGYGYDLLQRNKADLIIAGGADAFSYLSFTGFGQLRAMAPEKCQPFDKNRKGMLQGEGSGVLIIETLDSAVKRNAPIYAEILGYGLSCDAFHMTSPHIDGIAECMSNALLRSGVSPDEVDYISAHGTGTRNNDKAESAAINKVFSHRKVPVSSIKSMLGHTMGAASAIEAVACCLSVKNDIIPPTINYETPDPECDIDCVPNQSRKQSTAIVLNNSFAFGGNNACLLLGKFNLQKE